MKHEQYNNKRSLINERRQLRNNATTEEKLLWEFLRKKQNGYKFRRQHSIENYILDFYCPEKRLAVEVDGAHHYTEEGKEYDKARTEVLNMHQISVMRFSNNEVMNNTAGVIKQIIDFIEHDEL